MCALALCADIQIACLARAAAGVGFRAGLGAALQAGGIDRYEGKGALVGGGLGPAFSTIAMQYPSCRPSHIPTTHPSHLAGFGVGDVAAARAGCALSTLALLAPSGLGLAAALAAACAGGGVEEAPDDLLAELATGAQDLGGVVGLVDGVGEHRLYTGGDHSVHSTAQHRSFIQGTAGRWLPSADSLQVQAASSITCVPSARSRPCSTGIHIPPAQLDILAVDGHVVGAAGRGAACGAGWGEAVRAAL